MGSGSELTGEVVQTSVTLRPMADQYAIDVFVAALRYAAAGYYVYPVTLELKPNGKKKVTPHANWKDASTTDAQTVADWFAPGKPYAGTGIGIDCEKSGIAVVDLDEGVAEDGRVKAGIANWDELIGRLGVAESDPFAVRTRSGGGHLFFRQREDTPVFSTTTKLAGDVDTRGVGGCVFAAPTRVQGTDQAYEWLTGTPPPPPADLPLIPAWVPVLLAEKDREEESEAVRSPTGQAPATAACARERMTQHCDVIRAEPVGSGNGNTTVYKRSCMVGQYVGAGQIDFGEAHAALTSAVDSWPHTDPDLYKSLDRGLRWGMARPRTWDDGVPVLADFVSGVVPTQGSAVPVASMAAPTTEAVQPLRTLRLSSAADVVPRDTEWLWRPADEDGLPLGELAVLVGKGGAAKSQILCWFAARISTGTLPGCRFGLPGDVIYLYREDSVEKTVVPRLMAAGADLSKVHFLKVSFLDDDDDIGLSLPRDCDALAEVIRERGVVAVLYDPLSSLLDVVDTNAQKTMRAAYERIRRMHEATDSTGLGLGHTRKAIAGSLLDAFMGSSEQGNVVRCAWGVIADDSDPDQPGRFLMSQEKNNLGKRAGSLTYEIVSAVATHPDPETGSVTSIKTSRVEFTGRSQESVSDILRDQMTTGAQSKIETATDWLRTFLTGRGELTASEIREAASEQKINYRTLQRAAARLSVVFTSHGTPGSNWNTWKLPGQDIPGRSGTADTADSPVTATRSNAESDGIF